MFALGLLLGLAFPASGLAHADNVVVVMTDDETVPQVQFMPAVQKLLVRQGTTFDNNFVVFPFCCPSRATFFSGQYPHNNGVADLFPRQIDNYRALDASETLPVWLNHAGYNTGHIGKYLNGYGKGPGPNGRHEVPRGWDRWVAPIDHTEYRYFRYSLNVDGGVETHGTARDDYQTDVLADHALDILDDFTASPKPFFLSVAPVSPHTERGQDCNSDANPRPAPRFRDFFADETAPRPPSFNETDMTDKPLAFQQLPLVDADCSDMIWRSQLASLLSVDEMVKRIVATLRQSGDLKRTLIIFTSDNGLALGEHRFQDLKRLPYEESIRVPLIVRGPGFRKNVHRPEMVANTDLAPTILNKTGAVPGADHPLDGRPLLSSPPRQELLLEERAWEAIRTPANIYVRYRDVSGNLNGDEELYDLQTDPFELNSLQDDIPSQPLKAQLNSRLDQVMHCVGVECP
ncbi:MAG: N-acetylglucosamine-6-sulfatase [Thermoleophilaceae bacterium]|nr:N-acetylglucosamine-6-sulfatase [Thermoleophilaceae bacterium]